MGFYKFFYRRNIIPRLSLRSVLSADNLSKEQKILLLKKKLSSIKTPAFAKQYFMAYQQLKFGKIIAKGWDGKNSSTLHLHHVNRNRKDNSVKNLRFVSPDAHCKIHLRNRKKVFIYC